MVKGPDSGFNVVFCFILTLIILTALVPIAYAADINSPQDNLDHITKKRARDIFQNYVPLKSEAHATKLIPYFNRESSQWIKAWKTSFVDNNGIVPVKTGSVIVDAKTEKVLDIRQLVKKAENQFSISGKRLVRGREISEERAIKTSLDIRKVLEIAREKAPKESKVYVNVLGMHKNHLCYKIVFKDLKKKRAGWIWIDADTGEIVDQYETTSAMENGAENGIEENSVEKEEKRYRDTVTPIEGRSAFIVGINDAAGWRDMAVLAAIPAAGVINNGKPVVLLGEYNNGIILLNNSVSDFLDQYSPADIYIVGGTRTNETLPGSLHTINGEALDDICVNIASYFWTDSNNVVIAADNDYRMALLASNLAAHLYSPLLWVSQTGISIKTHNAISSLKANHAFLVGDIPDDVISQIQALGLTTISLSNEEEINSYIQPDTGGTIDYAVLTNPYDRDALLQGRTTILPKLSLLAPALAAYHNGYLYTESYESVKYTFSSTAKTTLRPNGVLDGAERKYYSVEYTTSAPSKASGATWTLYPVNGNYFYGDLWDIERSPWDYHEFFLAASTSAGSSYDKVLIDLDDSTDYSDNEIFSAGGIIPNQYGDSFSIKKISGDGNPNTEDEYMEIKCVTWLTGAMDIDGITYNYIISSPTVPGYFKQLNIDLNHNSNYNDTGEGPFRPGDLPVINNIRYALSIELSADAFYLTYPDAQTVADELKDFYTSLNISPEYLAIVGCYDTVPFGIYEFPVSDPEEIPSNKDITSDTIYGALDDDPFMEIAVGRILAFDIYNESALISRSIAYTDLSGPWQDKGLILANHGDPAGDLPCPEAGSKMAQHHLENIGYQVRGLYENYVWNYSYLLDRGIIIQGDHAWPEGWNGGPNVWDNWGLNSPAMVFSGGCNSANIDEINITDSLAITFLNRGSIAYIGNTRVGIPCIGDAMRIALWDALIYKKMSLGQASIYGQNYMVYKIQNELLYGWNNETWQTVFLEQVIFSDPAITLNLPSNPSIEPARIDTSEEMTDVLRVEIFGPQQLWTDIVRGGSDNIAYGVSGPGVLFPISGLVDILIECLVPSGRNIEVREYSSLPDPLGWESEHCYLIDENDNGQSKLIWTSNLLEYDISQGNIKQQTDYIKYMVFIDPENRPPTAPEVEVTPVLPFNNNNLRCTIVTKSTDPDGDPISYVYQWYKDGELQSGLTTNTVSAAITAKGEVWRCVVTPSDGIIDGPSGGDQVTISLWSSMNFPTQALFTDAWGSSSSNVFVVGGTDHSILHYDGHTWSVMKTGIGLWGVWGSSPTDIFAVGLNGTIVHYNGSNWSSMNSGTKEHLYDVWGSASNDVFAVGTKGVILHYDGNTWSLMNSGTQYILQDVEGTSATDVFAVGGRDEDNSGIILHYDGTAWSTILNTMDYYLNDIWVNSSSDVFVTSGWGSILHYDGFTWEYIESYYSLRGIWGSSPFDIFAVGYEGTILHYDGILWRQISSGTNKSLYGIWGSSPSDVFAVGENGTILHYEEPANTYYRDWDDDGYGDPLNSIQASSSEPPEGYAANNYDCDDNDPHTHPGAPEQCNDKDNNCDGVPSPTANFTADRTTGIEHFTVEFTAESSVGTIFSWDFGDGTKKTITVPNIIHTYTSYDSNDVILHNVTLTVSIEDESCSTTYSDFITIQPVKEVGPGCPYTSIQAAIDAADDGEAILVHNGTYFENISFNGKSINLCSKNGPDKTFIDGKGTGSVVIFAHGEGVDAKLDGFTIQNGSAESGGGIYFDSNTSPTIINCTISRNTASNGGGIWYDLNSSPTITNCTISGNSSENRGGGIYCYSSSLTITNCIIKDNSTNYRGGGIYCLNSSPAITNCIITGNRAQYYGGGICCYSSSPEIINCNIGGNKADQGGGIYCDFVSSPTITNSIIRDNSKQEISCTCIVTYSNIKGGYGDPITTHNIDADPLFVQSENENFYLKPESPCIDAGTFINAPSEDQSGIIRPHGTGIDMGAYEFVGPKSCTPRASFTADRTTGEDSLSVVFDASSSGGSEYSHTEFLWEFGDGNTVIRENDSKTTYSYNSYGSYHVGLIVNTACGSHKLMLNDLIKLKSSQPTKEVREGYSYTIQDAIDEAIYGEIILVHNGTYFENINFKGKEITVCSKNGSLATIIDGTESGSVVKFNHGEGADAVLDGFTIQNGSAMEGGGIYCSFSSPTITNCSLISNIADYGGGIFSTGTSSPTVTNCIINKNMTNGDGGGIYSKLFSFPTITNCTIIDNISYGNGGGIGSHQSTSDITNCILWNNSPQQINGPCTVTYSNIQGGYGDPDTTHNLNVDPLFIDPNEGDYHLLSNSPCIDSGDHNAPELPPTDKDGHPRIVYEKPDIGAYEYIELLSLCSGLNLVSFPIGLQLSSLEDQNVPIVIIQTYQPGISDWLTLEPLYDGNYSFSYGRSWLIYLTNCTPNSIDLILPNTDSTLIFDPQKDLFSGMNLLNFHSLSKIISPYGNRQMKLSEDFFQKISIEIGRKPTCIQRYEKNTGKWNSNYLFFNRTTGPESIIKKEEGYIIYIE